MSIIILVIIIKKIILFSSLFFLFNISEIDSNSDKLLLYNKNDTFDENIYNIYFYDTSIDELERALNILKISVLSYIIDGKKYYVRNIKELKELYLKDKSIEEKIYYEKYSFLVDGISVYCINDELLKLESLVNVY